MLLQLEGTVVVYGTQSVTIYCGAQLSTDNIVRYNISIEKKRSDSNKVIQVKLSSTDTKYINNMNQYKNMLGYRSNDI